MTAQNIRFKYTDSNGNDQIAASTVGQGAEIDHATQYRNYRDVNIAKIWGGRGLFNAFPQQKSQFNTPEPEILLQEEVNGTWTTVGRFYAKGSGDIKDKESVANKLYGFQRYVEKQDIDISTTTTNIVDVAEKLPAEIEGNYIIETPAEADVDGGYPQVDNYSYTGKAESFVQDLSRKYKWTLKWTNRTDGNGNNIIRFEPKGYGGAVDTLDSNTTGLKFEGWEKERTESIVNKVKVIGVDGDGNKVTATANNQDMIDKYGVKYEKIKVGYVDSSSDAQTIAEERLNPGKDSNGNDITSPPEGGVVNLPTLNFREGIENNSVNLVDNELGIDDAFTVTKHKLFYPSGRSELHLDFEDEKTEDKAQKDDYLGDERAALFPQQTESDTVGPLDIDDSVTDTETVQDQYDADSQSNHDHGNSNVTSGANQLRTNLINTKSRPTDFTGGTGNNILSAEVPGSRLSASVDFVYVSFELFAKNLSTSGSIDVRLRRVSDNTTIDTYTFFIDAADNLFGETDPDISIVPTEGDRVAIDITGNSTGADIESSISIISQQNHDHFVTIPDTDGDTADITINVNTNDGTAGDTSNLTVSGQTLDELVEILTSVEEKTNR